jgi:predicted HTH domain antitoxin
MSVTIADEILQASKLTPQEFCQEIALHFFQTSRLSLHDASQLAELTPQAFRGLLKQHNIPLYSYDVEDFDLDLQNLKELGRL